MEENARKNLGATIKKKRELLGLSQTELAKSVGKSSPAYIAFIESGDRNVTTMDLMLIAKQLGTSVADLVGENTSKKEIHFVQALRSSIDVSGADKKKIEEYYKFLTQSKRNAG